MSDDATLDEFADTIAEENEEGSRITGLGTFPFDWDVERITRCAEIRDSERIPLNSQEREQKKPGEIPYYGANGVLDYISEYIFDSELILLAEDGGHFEEYQERPVAYRISGKSWVNNHAHILEAKDEIATDYLFYSLEHRNLVPYVSGSTRSKLTQTMLKKVEVPLPPLSEQRKIATVLHTVDQAIQKTEEVISNIRRIKSGIRQDLIPSGIKRHDYTTIRVGPKEVTVPVKWEYQSLSEVCNKVTDGTHETPEVLDEGYPFITSEDTVENKIDFGSNKYVSEEEHRKIMKRSKPEEGDILFTHIGKNTGNVARVEVNFEFSIKNVALFKPNTDIITSDYLEVYLRSSIVNDFVSRQLQGGAQDFLSLTELKKLPVLLPSEAEQQEISNVIGRVDNLEAKEKENVQKLQRLKRALMQDLLSGEVRTTDVNIDIPEEVAKYG